MWAVIYTSRPFSQVRADAGQQNAEIMERGTETVYDKSGDVNM